MELINHLLHSRFLSPPTLYSWGETVSACTFWPTYRHSRMLQSWYPYVVGCLHSCGKHSGECHHWTHTIPLCCPHMWWLLERCFSTQIWASQRLQYEFCVFNAEILISHLPSSQGWGAIKKIFFIPFEVTYGFHFCVLPYNFSPSSLPVWKQTF